MGVWLISAVPGDIDVYVNVGPALSLTYVVSGVQLEAFESPSRAFANICVDAFAVKFVLTVIPELEKVELAVAADIAVVHPELLYKVTVDTSLVLPMIVGVNVAAGLPPLTELKVTEGPAESKVTERSVKVESVLELPYRS